jgi:hypothetical protein
VVVRDVLDVVVELRGGCREREANAATTTTTATTTTSNAGSAALIRLEDAGGTRSW